MPITRTEFGFIALVFIIAAIVCYILFVKEKSPQPFWVLTITLGLFTVALAVMNVYPTYIYWAAGGALITWCLGFYTSLKQ